MGAVAQDRRGHHLGRHISRHCAAIVDGREQPSRIGRQEVDNPLIPFTAKGTDGCRPIKGVLKVLKPGIEERLEEELLIWSELAEYIDARCEQDGLPPLRGRELFNTVQQLLSNEVRLDLEQAHLGAAKAFFGDSSKVQIPVVLPCSTPRVTT